eukprot:c13151_g1_i3.p2 GENE.c13151_g1_i3~~c13151_g1_i3.p2  ORF type:complete len:173 (-),score=44.41 c13151_g1_i3:208-726(-)
MGGSASVMSSEQLADLQTSTGFTDKELKRLYKRFRKLDRGADGRIAVDEFKQIPELQMNPLVDRVVEVFDAERTASVSFEDFVAALSVFSIKGSPIDKLRFCFRMYDIDNDGFISNAELFQILKMMTGAALTDAQLQQVVDKTLLDADLDNDNLISFEEFQAIVAPTTANWT